MGLLFDLRPQIINSLTTPIPKMAESESIGANHLGFTKFLFQHYCQHLGLNQNHISAESVFNFYVNEKIAYLLETPVNTESARKIFYHELIQNTSLPTNYNFASIITEINKKIEHHTQQRYPITYASKGKEKLQTLAKHKVESLTNLLYYYTPRSAINITSTDASTLNVISTFGQFAFQSKQRKTDLLEPYEIMESEEESKDQEFTYQNPIPKNPTIETPNLQTQQHLDLENPEIKTLNIQTPQNHNNSNPELINQPNLLPVIVINQPLIKPIIEPIKPPQQPQQLFQQLQ
ncbi:hypothetical protein G9A89_003188 [Geosiphon pyriformis]|nr:hypothetical protein G9A89_003188 [Geosiphon pyriformis]